MIVDPRNLIIMYAVRLRAIKTQTNGECLLRLDTQMECSLSEWPPVKIANRQE